MPVSVRSQPSPCHRLRLPPLARASLALGLLLGACGTGQTGDSCWVDDDCTSGSCSYGNCAPSTLELLAWLASFVESDPPPEPPPPDPPPSPTLSRALACGGQYESQCRAAGCDWVAHCLSFRDEPDAGTVSCASAYSQTARCPSQCFLLAGCL